MEQGKSSVIGYTRSITVPHAGRASLPRPWNYVYLLITIMAVAASHPHLLGQEVTSQAPPVKIVSLPLNANATDATSTDLLDEPGATRFPTAVPLPVKDDSESAIIESDTQTEKSGYFVLDGNVVVTYGDRTVKADHVEYDSDTGDLTATGHLLVTGGLNSERITASHGTANLNQQ